MASYSMGLKLICLIFSISLLACGQSKKMLNQDDRLGPREIGTWSIAAFDSLTGEVGMAGASCTHNVQGIAEALPGKGVVVVQANSNDDARARGMEMLAEGSLASEIIAEMRNEKFDPENQQYAVVDSTLGAAGYTGKENDSWGGHLTGRGVSVQGNSLVGEEVVRSTFDAYQKGEGSLAERLVRALSAGDQAGGDKRCAVQRSRSSFVTVYRPSDSQRHPYFHLVVYGLEKGGDPAVPRLVEEFESLFARGKMNETTRVYISPGN